MGTVGVITGRAGRRKAYVGLGPWWLLVRVSQVIQIVAWWRKLLLGSLKTVEWVWVEWEGMSRLVSEAWWCWSLTRQEPSQVSNLTSLGPTHLSTVICLLLTRVMSCP
jgi:hypothetical protein